MASEVVLKAGDRVLVGTTVLEVSPEFAASLSPGDEVLGVASTRELGRIPATTRTLVSDAVGAASGAFVSLQSCSDAQISRFFGAAADRLSDSDVSSRIFAANVIDVAAARERGRSTTRLEIGPKMLADMVAAFRMWRDAEITREVRFDEIRHDGWSVEQWRSPLGVIGFVFEGRPNVFADATGVLRTGNTVVFRIGSDALGTARSIMDNVVRPALAEAGLPADSVMLVDSVEHAAGWALFSDSRVALAVARGSGQAVSELGAIARQSGINVSLHGTGGAWIIAGVGADADRLAAAVTYSLDRKVCNTVNTVCVVRERAAELIDVVLDAARRAAESRSTSARVHATPAAIQLSEALRRAATNTISVVRTTGESSEPCVSAIDDSALGNEHEWEVNPELNIAVVDSVAEAVDLFNRVSPRFIVSVVSEFDDEQTTVWQRADAPFVGDGFTRWVDGQFALLRPELGLSNWQGGRLLGRGGVLSGDSAFTVRLRVRQQDPNIHR